MKTNRNLPTQYKYCCKIIVSVALLFKIIGGKGENKSVSLKVIWVTKRYSTKTNLGQYNHRSQQLVFGWTNQDQEV